MRLALLLVLSLVAVSAVAEGWICVEDSASGFRYDTKSKRWNPLVFRADQRFVIRRPQESDPISRKEAAWVVMMPGKPVPQLVCWQEFNGGFLDCKGVGNLTFNSATLKFTHELNLGYFAAEEALAAMPGPLDIYLLIGRCTTL